MLAIKHLLGCLIFVSLSFPLAAIAQPVPDETLGSENSRVRRATVRGREADLIEGGATRGNNLFHSFREFSIRDGDAAYFANPEAIENIFSRVTGNLPSNINGTLGVDGFANLFLMNPNGILFGQNARLDVGGSFLATTANAIGFGDLGFFSATNPEVPSQLLTVDLSAFLFNQIPTGNIASTSASIQMNDSQSLTLLGGNVTVDGGQLDAWGGRVEIGSVSGIGKIGFNTNGSLNFLDTVERGDVVFTNGSSVDVRLGSGGDIEIKARNINILEGSLLQAGIFAGLGSPESQAGDITLDATNTIQVGQSSFIRNNVGSNSTGRGGNLDITAASLLVTDGSQLSTSAFGRGDAGNVIINARDQVQLQGADVFSRAGRISSTGEVISASGGDIRITTGSLVLSNGAQLNASTLGEGDAGSVIINARDRVQLQRRAGVLSRSRGVSSPGEMISAGGQGGDVRISTSSLTLSDGAQLDTGTLGEGDAGSVIIDADQVQLQGAGTAVYSSAGGFLNGEAIIASGQGGDIRITTGSLTLSNGAQLTASTLGEGDAGSVIINARDQVQLQGADVFSRAGGISPTGEIISARGQGGDVRISTSSLTLSDGAQLNASTLGEGDAGSVIIDADQAQFQGAGTGVSSRAGGISPTGSVIAASGQGGDVHITTGSLSFSDGATLTASTLGEGDAGSVIIDTSSLSLSDGAQLSSSTFGEGSAGSVIIDARDDISLNGVGDDGRSSAILTNASASASGRAGTITLSAPTIRISAGAVVNARTANAQPGGDIGVTADRIELTDGGQIITTTLSSGRAGNIILNADQLILSGQDATFPQRLEQFGRGRTANEANGESGLFANTRPNTTGNGGTITLNTNVIELKDGATIAATTSGTGSAGDILVQNADSVSLDNAAITTVVNTDATLANPDANQGNIVIDTRSLSLNNNSKITASTLGRGNAGDITVRDADNITLDNSTISTTVNPGAIGNGGSIDLGTNRLQLDRSNITASTSGQGSAGGINIRGADSVSLANSSISTEVAAQNAVGQGGNIDINTGRLNLDQAQINSSTSGQGNTGSIAVQASQGINLNDRSRIATDVQQGAIGYSQNIALQTPQLILSNNSEVSAATDGRGRAGSIAIQGTASNTPAARVSLSDSTISTEIRSNGIANSQAGSSRSNIDLRTQQLDLNNSSITASTSGQGDAGNIRIRDANTISLDDQSAITTTVNAGAIGAGGDVTLQTGSLGLDNRSRISSSTAGQGDTGAISINATDSIQLRDRSQITSEVQAGATGDSQQITIRTPELSLRGGSTISAATNGTGRAGDIRILEADRVTLANSSISTEVRKDAIVPDDSNREAVVDSRSRSDRNPQSNITINTRSLNLDNNARITASTRGQGNAGDITVNSDTITLDQGSRLTTSTSSDRSAGNILLNVEDATEIRGNGSGIFANTEATGNGGSITLNTDTLNLDDQARISARSTGRGEAGDIRINSQSLSATNSTLETAAQRASGGTIEVNPNQRNGRITLNNSTITTNSGDQGGNIRLGAEQILLRGDSDITTSSGGNGGNIDITAANIIALNDSDILANSRDARGGNITLDTPAFFGSGYVPDQITPGNLDGNGRVDIDASGSTASGRITTPDTSFIQNSLSDLPDNSIDTDQLLANSCIVRDRNQPQGQFVITGADGLPDRPGSIALPDFPTGEIRNIPTETETNDRPWQLGDPVVEPQGVYRLPGGRLVMSRECSSTEERN